MAVYTKVSDDDAREFLRAYNIGELRELVGVREGVENTNYLLYTTEGRYVLTLYERRVKEEDLPFFIGLMEHLGRKNMPVPMPVRVREGGALRWLSGRPALVTRYLEGRPAPTIGVEECANVGRALAQLHMNAEDFQLWRDNAMAFPAWEGLHQQCKARAGEVLPGLGGLLEEEVDFLRHRWPGELPRGVIHADLFPDNVFFDGSGVCGIIDFYFACNDLLAYDLAICLNAWCFENDTAFNITKARALVRGYDSVRPLAPREKRALPLLSRGAALRFLLSRLYDWLNRSPAALVKPKDPLEYLTRLQFHQMVEDVTAYGLD